MDEVKIKPRLLVVGDSFMKPDLSYPRQHWSEMLPEYEILMYSISGSSNGIIINQFFQGLKQFPDAVVFGFTEFNRIEFDYNNTFITNSHGCLTQEQNLLVDLYKIHTSHRMQMIKTCAMIRGAFLTLEKQQIPYAWTLNLLGNDRRYFPEPGDPSVNEWLGEFKSRETNTNLATYSDFKTSPGFHTDDPVWQSCFAQEVKEILQK
jgi:hypothetical protein